MNTEHADTATTAHYLLFSVVVSAWSAFIRVFRDSSCRTRVHPRFIRGIRVIRVIRVTQLLWIERPSEMLS